MQCRELDQAEYDRRLRMVIAARRLRRAGCTRVPALRCRVARFDLRSNRCHERAGMAFTRSGLIAIRG